MDADNEQQERGRTKRMSAWQVIMVAALVIVGLGIATGQISVSLTPAGSFSDPVVAKPGEVTVRVDASNVGLKQNQAFQRAAKRWLFDSQGIQSESLLSGSGSYTGLTGIKYYFRFSFPAPKDLDQSALHAGFESIANEHLGDKLTEIQVVVGDPLVDPVQSKDADGDF